MSMQWSWLLAIILALYLLRRLVLPRPIPGIPFNKKATNQMLGDIPDVLRHIWTTGEVADFIPQAGVKLNSPIYQLFMRPFAKPWVIITDFRETQDIVSRRTREFDRSNFFREVLSALVPKSQIHMPTGDGWRAQRKLVGDTMTPSFLENVSAPTIYASGQDLISLWKEKIRLAGGRPFNAKDDVYRTFLDTIWAVTFGAQIGATRGQYEELSTTASHRQPGDMNTEASFPVVLEPEAYKNISALGGSVEIPVMSGAPFLHHWLALRLFPSLAKATKHKKQLITGQIDIAVKRFSQADASDKDVKCAMDHIIHREVQQATKDGRQPTPHSAFIEDELFGFLLAGHDTSATTLAWGLKLLTDNQRAQDQLRQSLYTAFADAKKTGTLPSVHDLTASKIPYLEATLQEIYRLSGTASAIFRKATTDVVVLGHAIPKGTDVCMVVFGPDFVQKSLHIDESKRSKSCQESINKNGVWDQATVTEFLPERWLTTNAAGTLEFDSRAGPSLLFGGGPRACFGRKLAELQIKLLVVLIVWSFRLETTPVNLSSYKARDGLTHSPRQCFLRLIEAA